MSRGLVRGVVNWSWAPFFPTNELTASLSLGPGAPACARLCCQGTLSLGSLIFPAGKTKIQGKFIIQT